MSLNRNDIFFWLGRPLAPLYGCAMRLRAWLYRRDIWKRHDLPVPVVSVGNLTLGGSGKTPTVRMLARHFLEHGFRPAVISRGYGGTARKAVNIVSDGATVYLSPQEAGDEPYMLAASTPGLVVLTGRKRIHPCRQAITQMGCDLIILDDGFQHLPVNRDVNIVLFNGSTFLGNSRVFPGGELREPLSALNRATTFLITGVSEKTRPAAEAFAQHLSKKHSSIPTYFSRHTASSVIDRGGCAVPALSIDASLYAFSGIAHPERFLTTLAELGFSPRGSTVFADHAVYSQADLDTLCRDAQKHGATALITTEKDWVKVSSFATSLPLYALTIDSVPDRQFLDAVLLGVRQHGSRQSSTP